MNKIQFSVSMIAALSFACQGPALAGSTSSKNGGKSTARSCFASFPKKCAGVVVGTIVGIPVCLVRRPWTNEKHGIDQMTSNYPQPRVVVPAAIFYAPFALAAGVFEAPWVSSANSFANFDKPFSKEQFSIVDTSPPDEPVGTPVNPTSKLETHDTAR